MKRAATLVAVSLSALSLAACASAGTGAAKLGTVKEPESFNQAEVEYDSKFSNRPAVQRVRVPGGLFISRPIEGIAPSSLLDKRVEIDIRSDVPTLADLQTLLDVQGVPMTIDWKSLESGTKKNARVCNFTAASRYQNVANSVSGGTGVQNRGGGLNGGLNGGINSGGINNGGVNNGGINNGGINNGGINNGGFNSGGVGNTGFGNGNSGGGNNTQIVGSFDEDKECIEENDTSSVSGQASADGSESRASDSSANIKRKLPAIYDRSLPFRYFKGSVGELMRRLETAGNIAVWYDGGLVVGDVRRYSVSVMQNRDIVQSIVNELIRLGAKNVTGSIGAGQIFYEAPPRTNAEILEPYLRRLQGNLSEVTLQVALVTVSMSHNAERGFDWSAFNFGYGANVTKDTLASDTSTGTGTGTGTGASVSAGNRLGNGVFTFNNNALNANLGDVLGTGKIISVAGAIKFLSRMGNTSVAQNVELRTLSGSPVILRSGESIPYVQNVGATSNGGLAGGTFGSSQTAAIGTGLTLNVDPRYDSTSGIVTMDIGMRLVDLVEFVQLNAGAQLGTLTQPRTREQGINSIVRLEAGQTAILGGIRRDLTSDARTGPLDAFAIGSRNRSREVFWLFAIVRPVVTVYETTDVPLSPRSVLDTNVTVNPLSDGSYGNRGYSNAGVVTTAPTVARDVQVIAPSTPATVSPLVAPRTVVREAPAPISRTEIPASNAPVAPAPQVVSEPVVQQPAPRRSFIRPMSDAEKGSN